MILEGKISFLINPEYTTIEIEDEFANTRFLEIRLTPDELGRVLSRQGHVSCTLNVRNLERVGKKHEHKTFEFEIPQHLSDNINKDRSQKEKELNAIAQSQLTDGWISAGYFGSQNSFFKKDGKQFARVTIRRYI